MAVNGLPLVIEWTSLVTTGEPHGRWNGLVLSMLKDGECERIEKVTYHIIYNKFICETNHHIYGYKLNNALY